MPIQREWKDGDKVDLEIPLKLRVEPIDPQHTDTVALLAGPLVLFGDQAQGLTRAHLLAAKNMAPELWHVSPGGDRVLKFVPWTVIEDEPYKTYLRVT
jgi:DUF1680 family protein